jgi:hypothetical protein
MSCWLDSGEDLGGGRRLPLLHGVGAAAEGGLGGRRTEDGGRREDGASRASVILN